MNSLLILPSEIRDSNTFVLEGKRAKEFHSEHQISQGAKVSAALLDGLRGEIEVIEVGPTRIVLKGELFGSPPAREPITAIIAIPRPQTIRKILQLAATIGIEALHFVKSDGTQKSYLQSKMLLDENIKYYLRLGLEQTFDSVSPKVFIHQSLKHLLEHESRWPSNAAKYLAHTPRYLSQEKRLNTLAEVGIRGEGQIVLAIGPESGWSESEVGEFRTQGFRNICLGERIYRVDTALTIMIGQIQALRELSKGNENNANQ